MGYAGKSLDTTVEGMLSPDYQERFKAEYQQASIRYWKLNDMLVRYAGDKLDFEPKCPYELLDMQLKSMGMYLSVLEARAKVEGIEL